MLVAAVASRRLASDEAVVKMAPVIGRCINRIDAKRFYGVDGLKHALDPRPAADARQDVAAGTDKRQRLIGFTAVDWAHDVDARDDRAEVVGRPAHEREDTARREAEHAAAAIEDRLAGLMTEADPMLDTSFKPGQLDVRHRYREIHARAVRAAYRRRSRRAERRR